MPDVFTVFLNKDDDDDDDLKWSDRRKRTLIRTVKVSQKLTDEK